jgi:CheY-like chemotaxis protein
VLPAILLVPADSEQPTAANSDLELFSGTLTMPIVSSQLYDVLLNVLSNSNATMADYEQRQTMADRHPLRILIVEDNEINRRILKNMLDKLGYQTDAAINGHIAVQLAAEKKYDVILMDIQMPVMDGVEAAQRILAACSGKERPYIITVTAHAMEGDREHYLAAGMNEYVSKPVTMNRLVEVLYQAVNYHDQLLSSPGPTSSSLIVDDKEVATEPTDIPTNPIDLVELAQLVGENTDEFLQIMSPIFLEDTKNILQKLAAAVQGQDSPEIRHAAHTLKGSSASMGMTRLSQLCRDLEMMAKEDHLAEAAPKLEQIQVECTRVEAALNEMVETAV